MVQEMDNSIITNLKLNSSPNSISNSVKGIAHDLRNMLSAIHGYLQLLEDDIKTESSGHSYLVNAKISTELALNLNRRLLQPEAQSPLYIKPGESIKDIAESILGGTHIEWSYTGYQDLSNLFIDKLLFERVLENILSNSVKAMAGRGKISISACNIAQGNTIVHELDDQPYLQISIIDDGPGMDPFQLEKLKEQKYDFNNINQGMGLVIIEEIMKALDGYIEMASQQDYGTRTTLYLPIKKMH